MEKINENITFEELLNQTLKEIKVGQTVTGTVIEITPKNEVFIDIGYKADGIIPANEYILNAGETVQEKFKLGDRVTAVIVKLNDGLGNVLLSYNRARREIDQKEFESKVNNNTVFKSIVSEVNEKGLITNFNTIKIFIPLSLSGINRNEDPHTYKGKEVKFKVIEYNPKTNRIIGSIKQIADEEKKAKLDEFWNNVEVGKMYTGTVTSLSEYGAFVDINGVVQGLLHISEMTWERDKKPKDILEVGQEIKVKVKEVDKENKRLKLIYYTKPVLGEDGVKSNGYINLDYDKNNNIILAKNMYLSELLQSIAYVSCSEKIKSYTGNKNFFFGKGGIQNPDGIKKVSLNNENSLGQNTCICYEIEIEVESFSEKEISILLGAEDNIIDCKNMSYKYSKIPNCKQELNDVKSYWKELLGRIQVYTPLESVNIILNGWLAYQTIESRLLGRTGFYQSGGAYGFRDQLQDTFGLKYLDPDLLKNQIIKHSKHQFLEGDVEHWWHEETKKGIRTKFSDDLLWLVFATIEYILFTGDKNILDIKTKYITGQELADGQDEKYDVYLPSDVLESIYDHCKKAIEKSLNFGEHGLPKIGSGDWNDGFSTVGNKGKGESVWLRIFHVLYFR